VVGRELVQENDRRPATGLFEIETNMVARYGMGQWLFLFVFLLDAFSSGGPAASKIAVNARGRNEAGSFLFRHGMIAE
jgi:hypothetical protein